MSFNLRKRTHVSYYEPEEPSFDKYICKYLTSYILLLTGTYVNNAKVWMDGWIGCLYSITQIRFLPMGKY